MKAHTPQVKLDKVLNQLAFIIGGLDTVSEYCRDGELSPVDGCVELLYGVYDAIKNIKEDLTNTTEVINEVEEQPNLIIPVEEDPMCEILERFKGYNLSDKELGLSLIECKILGYMEVTDKTWFCVSDIVNNTNISRNTVVKYLKQLRDLNMVCSSKLRTTGKIGNMIWWSLTDKYKSINDIIVFISYKLHRYMIST